MSLQDAFTPLDLAKTLDQSIAIVEEAAEILRQHAANPQLVDRKSSIVDLVTKADRDTEALIVRRLGEYFPAHQIVGEEGGSYDADDSLATYRWFIDPIDGTTNFTHGIPHFSISLALVDEGSGPLVGIVYDVMRQECFAAARGRGTMLNNEKISVSSTEELAASVVGSGFPYDKWTDNENNVAHWGNFVVRTQGVRRIGSAALDLAYVAAGRFDGYWESKLHLWDMMAGALLVQEAGGRVTNFDGSDNILHAQRPKIVASNGKIHDAMLQVIADGDNAPLPA